jgi:uncharacterized protein
MTDDAPRITSDAPRGGGAEATASESIEPWLMALLVCPVDHGAVRGDGAALVCAVCGRRYPVRDGVPVMLADEAE